MQRILAISSFVAHGAVGLQALVPPLLRPGRDVISMPAVVYSNHPAHKNYFGEAIAPEWLQAMMDALDANGWLSSVAAIVSGYLPTPEHVEFTARAVERVRRRNPGVIFLCDPVLGDHPHGLYIRRDAAMAIRDNLAPAADIVTPNRFELGELTGEAIENAASAVTAARKLQAPRVAVTSVRETPAQIANVFITPAGTWMSSVNTRPTCPHGTGDLFAGLLLAALLDGAADEAALAHAAGGVDAAIARSTAPLDLDLAGMRWTADAITPADTVALPA